MTSKSVKKRKILHLDESAPQSIKDYRTKERNISAALISKPTLPNIIKAAYHYNNSLTGKPEDKYLLTGTPPGVVPTKIKSFLELMSYVMPKEGYKQLLTTGSISGLKKLFYPKGKIKIISNDIKDDIIHNVGNRLANQRTWYSREKTINDVRNNIPNTYREFPQYVFDKASGTKAFGNYYNGNINLSDKASPHVLKHEIRHKLDEVFPYTETEEYILDKALGKDFNDITKRISSGNEMSTTIGDFRNTYLKPHELKLDINAQNKIIDEIPTDRVFDVLENANGYGEKYVQWLRRFNYDTPEKAEAIKTAAKNIGIGVGLYPIVNQNKNARRKLANGGSIYIKPSHRGSLTELKARTGKSESELYNDGNPAHKKMVVFARNARKWHH